MTRKEQVAAAFSAAAATYETAAEAQARAADSLTARVLAETLPPSPQVLEIGCGTGLLTRRLLPRLGGEWLITDLSPAMIETARSGLGAANARFRVMDGEHPDLPTASLDLIVSSLAVQWFAHLPQGLKRLAACLKPGGLLAVTTLGQGSFGEWRQAHRILGLESGTPLYPSAEELAAQLPATARVIPERITVAYGDAHAFLAAVKRVGAATPAPGHIPLSPGSLRRVIRQMGKPAMVTYELLHVLMGAP